MSFTREINHLVIGMLIIFVVIAISSGYWATIEHDQLLAREDNPRLVLAESRIVRGDIYDRTGKLIAETLTEGETPFRQYLYPALNSAIGYSSLRYGVGGAESAFDTILRGDDLTGDFADYFEQGILHRTQQGSDIRVTFDLELQQLVADQMAERNGAVVVLSVPDGEVLSMVSLPMYDPNTLDENWDQLIEAEGNPFFNRVLQGQYQPGGILQTPLMAVALLSGYPTDQPYENATQPVLVGDTLLECASEPPSDTLTLGEAYIYGCPYPFMEFLNSQDAAVLTDLITKFQLSNSRPLGGFVTEDTLITSDSNNQAQSNDTTITDDLMGQGQLTLNPLSTAMFISAIINKGNAPQPHTLLETRAPDSESWQSSSAQQSGNALITDATAQQLKELMVANLTDENDEISNVMTGSHSALAFTGENMLTWYTGFAQIDGNEGVVVVSVLEDNDDLELANEIGENILNQSLATISNENAGEEASGTTP